MVVNNEDPKQTAFTVTVDYKGGVHGEISTGISSADRAATMRALADESTPAADFNRPGHIFPLRARDGGVLVRTGHTEVRPRATTPPPRRAQTTRRRLFRTAVVARARRASRRAPIRSRHTVPMSRAPLLPSPSNGIRMRRRSTSASSRGSRRSACSARS